MWVLNTTGLQQLGLDDDSTGRLYGLDDLIRDRIEPQPVDLTAAAGELAAHGVTGVTDLTPTEDPGFVDALAEQALAPEFPLRVTITGAPALPASAGRGLRGPAKVVIGDHDLPTLDNLIAAYRQARASGRNVAVHCASRIASSLALAAWEAVGARPGDRIEHGAVIPLELVPRLRALGLIVVTQPAFVAARGDQYLSDVEAADVGDLWRCGSLLDAGVGVGGSTTRRSGRPIRGRRSPPPSIAERRRGRCSAPPSASIQDGRWRCSCRRPTTRQAHLAASRPALRPTCASSIVRSPPCSAPGDARVVATLGRAGLCTFG